MLFGHVVLIDVLLLSNLVTCSRNDRSVGSEGRKRMKRDLLNLLGWCSKAGVVEPAVSAFEHDVALQTAPKDNTRSELEDHHACCPYKYLFLGMLLQSKLSEGLGKDDSSIKKFFRKKVPPKIAIVSDNSTELSIVLTQELPPLTEEIQKVLGETTLLAKEGLEEIASTLPKSVKIISVSPDNTTEQGEDNILIGENYDLPEFIVASTVATTTAHHTNTYYAEVRTKEDSAIRRFFKVGLKTTTTFSPANQCTSDKNVYLPEDLPVDDEFYDMLNLTSCIVTTTRPLNAMRGLFSHFMNFSRFHGHNESSSTRNVLQLKIPDLNTTSNEASELETNVPEFLTTEFSFSFLNETFRATNGNQVDFSKISTDTITEFPEVYGSNINETHDGKLYELEILNSNISSIQTESQTNMSNLDSIWNNVTEVGYPPFKSETNVNMSCAVAENYTNINRIQDELSEFPIHIHFNNKMNIVTNNVFETSEDLSNIPPTFPPVFVNEIKSQDEKGEHSVSDILSWNITSTNRDCSNNITDIQSISKNHKYILNQNKNQEERNQKELEHFTIQSSLKPLDSFSKKTRKLTKAPQTQNVTIANRLLVQVPKSTYSSVLKSVLEMIGFYDKTTSSTPYSYSQNKIENKNKTETSSKTHPSTSIPILKILPSNMEIHVLPQSFISNMSDNETYPKEDFNTYFHTYSTHVNSLPFQTVTNESLLNQGHAFGDQYDYNVSKNVHLDISLEESATLKQYNGESSLNITKNDIYISNRMSSKGNMHLGRVLSQDNMRQSNISNNPFLQRSVDSNFGTTSIPLNHIAKTFAGFNEVMESQSNLSSSTEPKAQYINNVTSLPQCSSSKDRIFVYEIPTISNLFAKKVELVDQAGDSLPSLKITSLQREELQEAEKNYMNRIKNVKIKNVFKPSIKAKNKKTMFGEFLNSRSLKGTEGNFIKELGEFSSLQPLTEFWVTGVQNLGKNGSSQVTDVTEVKNALKLRESINGQQFTVTDGTYIQNWGESINSQRLIGQVGKGVPKSINSQTLTDSELTGALNSKKSENSENVIAPYGPYIQKLGKPINPISLTFSKGNSIPKWGELRYSQTQTVPELTVALNLRESINHQNMIIPDRTYTKKLGKFTNKLSFKGSEGIVVPKFEVFRKSQTLNRSEETGGSNKTVNPQNIKGINGSYIPKFGESINPLSLVGSKGKSVPILGEYNNAYTSPVNEVKSLNKFGKSMNYQNKCEAELSDILTYELNKTSKNQTTFANLDLTKKGDFKNAGIPTWTASTALPNKVQGITKQNKSLSVSSENGMITNQNNIDYALPTECESKKGNLSDANVCNMLIEQNSAKNTDVRRKRRVMEPYVDFNLRYCLFPTDKNSYEEALSKSLRAIKDVQKTAEPVSSIHNIYR